MVNPYREHADQIQALVKRLTREQMYLTRPEERFAEDDNYAQNFVVASGGEPFDAELTERLKALMKDLTGTPDPEIVEPPPAQTDEEDFEEQPVEELEEEAEVADEPDPENL